MDDASDPVIDRDLCYGSGDCELLHPSLFKLGSDGIATLIRPTTAGDDDAIASAIADCPSGAISRRR